MTQCPWCGSQKLWKDGLRKLADSSAVQRWLCRDCGYRFTDPNNKRNSQWKNPPFSLNLQNSLDHNCQGNNDPERRDSTALAAVQTLATVEKRNENRAAGATNKSNVPSNVLEFAWHLKKLGRKEETIANYVHCLRFLIKLGADLADPETVSDVVARQQTSVSRKHQLVKAYKQYAQFKGITFECPNYKPPKTLPFIPLESEVDQLIACCSKRLAALLQLLRETGCRLGEALSLQWVDIDHERRVVKITAEKNGEPRFMKVSGRCLEMLLALPRKNSYIFGGKNMKSHYQKSLQWFRKKAVSKLQNPRLLKIHFHTLRHLFATLLYHKTKDPWFVKRMLGHRSLMNTEIYINIEQALFQESNEEFHVKTASSIEEAVKLVELGFEYVTEMDGVKIFRRRK